MLLGRIAELEARLNESEETLDAIRRGEIDALVVGGRVEEQQVYTLDTADRPYRVLIEQIQEGAVTLTEDGTVLYCNRRLALLLGTAQERVIGQSLRPYAAPDQRDAFDQLLRDGTQARKRGEITLHAADGTEVPVLLSLSPLDGSDGAMLLCGVVTDLTEQRIRLGELAQANARLEGEIAERERVEEALRQSQKMEAVGQLTGGLAHDFNNLLTGIIGALELLTTRMAQGRFNDVQRYVSAAQGASTRAAALTHRLLAFSRRQTLDPKPTRGDQLVAGMMDLVCRTVGPGIAVDTVAADGLWAALCDPNQLENAVLNLCINARDAMPEGGRLRISDVRGRPTRPPRRHIAAFRDMPPGTVRVRRRSADTGAGMPPDVAREGLRPRSSRRSRSAWEPAWVCPWSTASPSSPAARCASTAWKGPARRSESTCQDTWAARKAKKRHPNPRAPHGWAMARRCWWWTTSPRCAFWSPRFWRISATPRSRPPTAHRGWRCCDRPSDSTSW